MMTSPIPDAPVARPSPTAAEREAVLGALGEAYAGEQLEMDELELRMARVYRATSYEALASVLADLRVEAQLPVPVRDAIGPRARHASPRDAAAHPSSYAEGNGDIGGGDAAGEDIVERQPASIPWWRNGRPSDGEETLAATYGLATIARPGAVPERGVAIAVFGGAERKGAWVLPRTLQVFAAMGGVDLDLREAHFGDGVSEINVYAFMGGVDIKIPMGVRVEVVGTGIMGGFSVSSPEADPGPDAPVIRISGLALMGGVDAKAKKLKRKT